MTCGEGVRTRMRTCTEPVPLYGGVDCPGDATEEEECSEPECYGN